MLQYRTFALFLLTFSLRNAVLCNNLSSHYFWKPSQQERLISFDTQGDIRLDLDFTVPFITLPIKKSIDQTRTSLVNLNVGSLILAGVVVFGVAVVLPVVLIFLGTNRLIPSKNPLHNFGHLTDGKRVDDSEMWKSVNSFNISESQNYAGIISCSQVLLCQIAKQTTRTLAKGQGSSLHKFVDAILSSNWLQHNVMHPMLIEAITIGLRDDNCFMAYGKCGIHRNYIFYFIDLILG